MFKVNVELRYSSIEIDESKIVGNAEHIFWMFGMVDRMNKDWIVFCCLEDRTNELLFPIIKKNSTYEYEVIIYPGCDENESIKTRIYSDCFQTYQQNDFFTNGIHTKKS